MSFKGYFYCQNGNEVNREPIELDDCMDVSIELAYQLPDVSDVTLEIKSASWTLMSLKAEVTSVIKDREVNRTVSGKLLICNETVPHSPRPNFEGGTTDNLSR
jgi:hypothetical protein